LIFVLDILGKQQKSPLSHRERERRGNLGKEGREASGKRGVTLSLSLSLFFIFIVFLIFPKVSPLTRYNHLLLLQTPLPFFNISSDSQFLIHFWFWAFPSIPNYRYLLSSL
jgi:hypothetical protein